MSGTDQNRSSAAPVWVEPSAVPKPRPGRRSRYEEQLRHLQDQRPGDQRWLAVESGLTDRGEAKRHAHALRQVARGRDLRVRTQIREEAGSLSVLARRAHG